ncbi:MAG: phosphoribosyltransferase [Chitinophagaceae bacterium]|nr:phosphoribosyltransferase [Chitinophagaceae bacterium]MCB9046332.1 phosphoribosyltransferase [Chitinophagales bacterium]
MGKQRTIILDKERINWKLQRMAYQVWENYSNEKSVTLIGIEGSGTIVAKSLARRLKEISPLQVETIIVKLNKRKPVSDEISISEDLTGKAVVLIDDVANSGKTLLYALAPILRYEPKKVMIAVLVDRRHKSFPITPDIVGHSVSTTLQEHIDVETEGEHITAAYLQ